MFDRCVVCRRRITYPGWIPFCCEVCFDSAYAADRELIDSYREGDSFDREGHPLGYRKTTPAEIDNSINPGAWKDRDGGEDPDPER